MPFLANKEERRREDDPATPSLFIFLIPCYPPFGRGSPLGTTNTAMGPGVPRSAGPPKEQRMAPASITFVPRAGLGQHSSQGLPPLLPAPKPPAPAGNRAQDGTQSPVGVRRVSPGCPAKLLPSRSCLVWRNPSPSNQRGNERSAAAHTAGPRLSLEDPTGKRKQKKEPKKRRTPTWSFLL